MINIARLLALPLLILLAACDRATPAASPSTRPITVVATTGMIADVAKNIAGPHATVTALMGPGVDPHLYKASTGDVRRLTDANLVLYNGLHLEGRMADLLVKLAATKTVVQVTDSIEESRLREPPEFEGHADPHVWFDVSLWAITAQRIADALAKADPAHASDYQSSAAAYIAQLNELHAWCKSELARIPKEQRILITAHDAFGYLGDAYAVEVLAIQGISTDSEASLKSVNALVDTIVERKVAAVFVESSVPHKTIESLIEGCKARGHNVTIGGELFSDALGPADSPSGTYIGMVKHNITTITTALLGKRELTMHTAPDPTAGRKPQADSRTAVEVHDLTVAYQRKPVLWDIDTEIPSQRLVAIIGPNGAGKSTLLKAILGLVPLASGYVHIFGKSLSEARSLIGYVPQREDVDWDFPASVLDVVLMGRYGKLGWLRRPSSSDRAAAMDALAKVAMAPYATRQISQLSGGQQQRVFLARAIAQDARLYLMDEPFAGVDAATERAIVEVLRTLRAEGRTVIAVHHDLQTVPEYFDHAIMLNLRLIAAGPVSEVFTNTNLQKTYGGRLTILEDAAEAVRRATPPPPTA